MAEDLSSIEKHIEWTEYINQRLDIIYKEICEYEKIINMQNAENQPFNLLELLESITTLHDAAKNLGPAAVEHNNKAIDINQQIDMLQNTMNLLKIDKPATTQQDNNDSMDIIPNLPAALF